MCVGVHVCNFCKSTQEINVKAEGTVITPKNTCVYVCVFNVNYEIYI